MADASYGWWVISGEFLMDLLRRAAAGEDPDRSRTRGSPAGR